MRPLSCLPLLLLLGLTCLAHAEKDLAENKASCAQQLVSNKIELPALESLNTTADIREYSEVLRLHLSQNSSKTVYDFDRVSTRADESLDMIKRSLVANDQPEGKNLLSLFGEFNDVATRMSPPSHFSPGGGNASVKTMVRSFLGRLGGRLNLPPTLEQWATQYAAEAPKFKLLRENVQNAIDETQRRQEAAVKEIDQLSALLEEKHSEMENLTQLGQEIEAQMEASQDLKIREQMKSSLLVPVLAEIRSLHEYIAAHELIVAQKKTILANSEYVIEEMVRTVNIAVPTLRQAAVAADDALSQSHLVNTTANLRELTSRTILTTSELISKNIDATNRLRETPVVSPDDLQKATESLLSAIRRGQESIQMQIPTLKENIENLEKLSDQLRPVIERKNPLLLTKE